MMNSMIRKVGCVGILGASLWLLGGCGGSAPPPATQAKAAPKQEAVKPPAARAPTPVAKAEPTPPAEEPPAIVIHEADLYGQIVGRQGKTVTVLSMLVTSNTQPDVGNRGVLFRKIEGGESEWEPIADVEVKSKLDAGGKLQVDITAEKEEAAAIEAKSTKKKASPISPKARVKLRWQW